MGKRNNELLWEQFQPAPEQDEENPGVALGDDDAWGNRSEADAHQKRLLSEAAGVGIGEWYE